MKLFVLGLLSLAQCQSEVPSAVSVPDRVANRKRDHYSEKGIGNIYNLVIQVRRE